jgi:hypothetical protein
MKLQGSLHASQKAESNLATGFIKVSGKKIDYGIKSS